MFTKFAAKLSEGLISHEFQLCSSLEEGGILSEKTELLLFMKNQSPIFYVIAVMNEDKIAQKDYEERINLFLRHINQNLAYYNCSRIICLHVLPYMNQDGGIIDWVKTTDLILDASLLQVFWAVNIQSGKITVGKGHPSQILNVKQLIEESVGQKGNGEAVNLREMENEISIKTALKIKSQDINATYALIIINVLIYFGMKISAQTEFMVQTFASNSFLVLNGGQFYRLITSMFLHGSITHLAYNCLSLYIFGSRIEKYLGKFFFLILYFVSGLGGSIASVFLTKGVSLGASGGIYGLIGGVLILSYSTKKSIEGLSYMTILIIVLSGIGIGFLSIGVDNFAHIGGLLSGCVFGIVYALYLKRKQKQE